MNDYPVTETSYIATNLQQKQSYEFRVCAINKAGSSKPSDATAPVTPKDPDGENNNHKRFDLTVKLLSLKMMSDD